MFHISKFKQLLETNKIFHFGTFLFLFATILLILYFATSSINLSYSYAVIASNILEWNGYPNEIFFTGDSYGLHVGEIYVNIGDVCTGLFELLVFLALILATLTVKIKDKCAGVLILIVLFFYFNLIRIYVMIMLLLFANPFITDFLHIVLFKIGFFIFFILFYYFWLTISTQKKETDSYADL